MGIVVQSTCWVDTFVVAHESAPSMSIGYVFLQGDGTAEVKCGGRVLAVLPVAAAVSVDAIQGAIQGVCFDVVMHDHMNGKHIDASPYCDHVDCVDAIGDASFRECTCGVTHGACLSTCGS
jgi:hypothetical protein